MEESKKYKLTDETKVYNGKTLYRIQALKDFDFIHKGEVGGFVESEKNLWQEGNCWIYDNAMVFDDARVTGDADVSDNAVVCGNSLIAGLAFVYGNAFINDSLVTGSSGVGDNAIVTNNVSIRGVSRIKGNAKIDEGVVIMDGFFNGDCKIHHQDDFITLPLWWDGNTTITYVFNDDKWFTFDGEYCTNQLVGLYKNNSKYIETLIQMANMASKVSASMDVNWLVNQIDIEHIEKTILPDGKVSLLCDGSNLQIVLEFDKEHRYKENDIKALNVILKEILINNKFSNIENLQFIKRTEISLWKEN